MAWYDEITNTTKNNVKGLVDILRNPVDAVKNQYAKGAPYRQALASALKGNMTEAGRALEQSNMTPMDVAMSFAPLGITTWHGSPSKFNKFDTSFAKTGAGAEAYGPGAYLSEGMDLAKGYQPRSDAFENAVGKLSERAYDTNNYAAADIYDNFLIHRTPEEVKSIIDEMYQGADAVKAKQALNQATKLYQTKSKGGLYKVDLPDEHLPYFLNWDEPISSQSKHIQDVAKKYGIPLDKQGQELISAAGGKDEAAKQLQIHGIKGVKYLDNYSPGSGAGTSNYLVYNPDILSILERNSVPIKK